MPESISKHVRVAYYARAAHDSDPTRQCLGRQAGHARTQIQTHPHWTLTTTSTDVGSGLRVHPGLRQLLDQARQGRFDLLLIERLSDLGRSLDVLTYTLTFLHAAGVELRTFSGERIDTAIGQSMTTFLLAIEESQPIRVTQRHKRRKG